jgi:hypothetical protein
MRSIAFGYSPRWSAMMALAALLALGGCDDGLVTLAGSNGDSRVLALMGKVRHPDPRYIHGSAEYDTGAERLQAAALVHLRGKTRVEALAALMDDGFVCTGTTCTTMIRERETWVVVHFGTRVYSVTVVGDQVGQMADLAASFTVTSVEADA